MWHADTSWECVALRGVTVRVRLGLHDFERQGAQRVSVDVELYRRHAGGRSGGFTACLDYDRLHRHLIEDWPRRPHTDLVEELAEDLVAFCFEDPRVEACRVAVRKLDIFAGRGVPEVTLYRLRPDTAGA